MQRNHLTITENLKWLVKDGEIYNPFTTTDKENSLLASPEMNQNNHESK